VKYRNAVAQDKMHELKVNKQGRDIHLLNL